MISGETRPVSRCPKSGKGWRDLGICSKQKSGWWYEPYPSEKYEFVNWDDEIPRYGKNKCSKPPTSSRMMFSTDGKASSDCMISWVMLEPGRSRKMGLKKTFKTWDLKIKYGACLMDSKDLSLIKNMGLKEQESRNGNIYTDLVRKSCMWNMEVEQAQMEIEPWGFRKIATGRHGKIARNVTKTKVVSKTWIRQTHSR